MLLEDWQQHVCNPASLEPASLAVALPSSQRTSVTTWTLAHVRAMENLGWSLLSYTWLFLLGELTLVSMSQGGTNRKESFRPVLTKPQNLTLDS